MLLHFSYGKGIHKIFSRVHLHAYFYRFILQSPKSNDSEHTGVCLWVCVLLWVSTDGSWRARISPCWLLAARGQGRSREMTNYGKKGKEHKALITLFCLWCNTNKPHRKIFLMPARDLTAIEYFSTVSSVTLVK